jgi:hypothetical protein
VGTLFGFKDEKLIGIFLGEIKILDYKKLSSLKN